MKTLYICDTPYQLFNVLNIVYNEECKQDRHEEIRHLFIINQFSTAFVLSERIKKKSLFSEVYLLSKDETKFLPVGIQRSIKMAVDFLNPIRFMKKRLGSEQLHRIGNIRNSYDTIYASGAFSTVAAMMKINQSATFILYEDGLGTYYGDFIVASSGGKANYLFCKLFHVGSAVCKPKALLVNNLQLCKSTSVRKENIKKLPAISEEFKRFCTDVFENEEKGDSFDLVWLTQPIDCTEGGEETREIVKKVLLDYRSEVGVRMHPRDLDTNYYSDFTICDNNNLWELYYLRKDINRLVLISYYSFAQFTPKYMFDLEPILIFTYKMNNHISEKTMMDFDAAVQGLKQIYRLPERVKTPRNGEELIQVLDSIIMTTGKDITS